MRRSSLTSIVAMVLAVGCSYGEASSPAPAPESTREEPRHDETPPPIDLGPTAGDYQPLAAARIAGGRRRNREAPIPVQCYTKTEGVSNPCWVCHTPSTYPNLRNDDELQREYSFSGFGRTNRWDNLFVDRSEAIAAISDAEALAYVRTDNYADARALLEGGTSQWGYPFDLDFEAGFDDEGFARDGSGWRAFRYKPFPGTFWPTNGSTDDVMVRLPVAFRQHEGKPSSDATRINLALLEASLASDPAVADDAVFWPTEPLDEAAVQIDLDGDGKLGLARAIRGLPAHWVGDASPRPLRRGTYPEGTEFLHTVRYLDPDAPSLIAARMKELRYLRKETELPRRHYFSTYAAEAEDKDRGVLPRYGGNAETGLLNPFGWRIQGFIEDAEGRLRLQTEEEHMFCMGCHSSIGVTADSTFSFPRKVPGAAGWGYQSIDDIPDVPQLGHDAPEVLTYFERVGGGDELRANEEILARFFEGKVVDAAEVRRAAPGGDRTLPHLVAPSRERALALDRAYMALVREQVFDRGRDALLAPPANVHRRIDDTATGLVEAGRVHRDGRLRLDWTATALWAAATDSARPVPAPRLDAPAPAVSGTRSEG